MSKAELEIITINFSRYPGLDVMWLVDFTGTIVKPVFPGKEGYSARDPSGPFLLSENDIRDCIKVCMYFGIE